MALCSILNDTGRMSDLFFMKLMQAALLPTQELPATQAQVHHCEN